MDIPEYSLELLLAYDGRKHFLESGYFLKFEVRRVEKTKQVPHGIAYSLTLHEPNGDRILGFDNAHPVAHTGSKFVKRPDESDHWHRTANDEGRPYTFESVEKLISDYFTEVERTLGELGIPFDIVNDEED